MEMELKINFEQTPDERILKGKIKAAETLYQVHKQSSDQIFEKIREKKVVREEYQSRIYGYIYLADVKARDLEIAHLECALYNLYGLKSLTKAGSSRLLSPLEEIDEQITLLHNRIHRCNTVTKEKHLIREIKEAKKAREKLVVANTIAKAETIARWGFCSKEAIEDKIKSLAAEREEIKEVNLEWGTSNSHNWRKIEAIDNDITSLSRKLEVVDQKKGDAYRSILKLRSCIPQDQ